MFWTLGVSGFWHGQCLLLFLVLSFSPLARMLSNCIGLRSFWACLVFGICFFGIAFFNLPKTSRAIRLYSSPSAVGYRLLSLTLVIFAHKVSGCSLSSFARMFSLLVVLGWEKVGIIMPPPHAGFLKGGHPLKKGMSPLALKCLLSSGRCEKEGGTVPALSSACPPNRGGLSLVYFFD